MFEYINEQQERFFNWCDHAVQEQTNSNNTMLIRCWPRKNPDGSYDLVILTANQNEAKSKCYVPVPEEFHELLEQEYFINHPPDEDKES